MGADLLVCGDQDLDAGPIAQRTEAVHGLHQATDHVEHPRTTGMTIGDRERPIFEGAHREDRVVVAEDEHHRIPAARPMHVRPGRALDQDSLAAEATLDHRRHCLCGSLKSGQVE